MKPSVSLISRLSICQRFLVRRSFSSWLENAQETKLSASTEKLFADPKVQGILKKLTGVSFEKVFETRVLERPENPFYRLMTTEELERTKEEAQETASARLQMPPMVESVPESGEILSEDTEIDGFDYSKFIFTDITYGISDKDRSVVVREPSGTLRTANCQEKERMIRLYFPQRHRDHEVPEAFLEPYLQEVLNLHRHLHILDWASLQFEPYDPEYARVMKTVFQHANQHSLFHLFWSTRYCGNMVFYLVINKDIDNYLLYLANEGRVQDMRDTIRLYHLCHEDSKSASSVSETDDDWKIIQAYIQEDAKNSSALELVVESLRQEINSQEEETAIRN